MTEIGPGKSNIGAGIAKRPPEAASGGADFLSAPFGRRPKIGGAAMSLRRCERHVQWAVRVNATTAPPGAVPYPATSRQGARGLPSRQGARSIRAASSREMDRHPHGRRPPRGLRERRVAARVEPDRRRRLAQISHPVRIMALDATRAVRPAPHSIEERPATLEISFGSDRQRRRWNTPAGSSREPAE